MKKEHMAVTFNLVSLTDFMPSCPEGSLWTLTAYRKMSNSSMIPRSPHKIALMPTIWWRNFIASASLSNHPYVTWPWQKSSMPLSTGTRFVYPSPTSNNCGGTCPYAAMKKHSAPTAVMPPKVLALHPQTPANYLTSIARHSMPCTMVVSLAQGANMWGMNTLAAVFCWAK